MRAAVFLDRDGVINENRPDYVKSWEEFVFLPGVFPPLRRLAESPFAVIVVSNQSAVGRGLLSVEDLADMNQRMVEEIARQGGRVDGVFCCPHRPSDNCECRKPRPGLLLEAAARHGLDLLQSFVVGDAWSDMEAALSAGCQPVLVLSGRGRQQLADARRPTLGRSHIAADLGAAVDLVLSSSGSVGRARRGELGEG